MGGADVHAYPRGWPHPKQCDSVADVQKLGRMDKMYDESKDVEKMERDLKFLEQYAKKYKYHEKQQEKQTSDLVALNSKI